MRQLIMEERTQTMEHFQHYQIYYRRSRQTIDNGWSRVNSNRSTAVLQTDSDLCRIEQSRQDVTMVTPTLQTGCDDGDTNPPDMMTMPPTLQTGCEDGVNNPPDRMW